MKTVCYITHNKNCRRVQDEIGFFKKHFNIIFIEITTGLFKTVFKLIKTIPSVDLVYSWQCDKSTCFAVMLCKLFGKPCYVVVSGFEPANIKEYNYGDWVKWIDRIFVRYIFNHATKILPVSYFTFKEIESKRKKPNNMELVYAGVNINDLPEPVYTHKDKKIVVTIADITWGNVYRKGLECFVKLGYYLPNHHFYLIGKPIDASIFYLMNIAAYNVSFTGYLSNKDFNMLIDKAKVYCQLSFYEAFGSGLAESMVKGCIPVVTKRNNDFYNIVGDTGYYVDYNNILDIVDAIKKAGDKNVVDMKRCRQRVVDLFNMDIRINQLGKVLL